jgi:hypothetical protein
VGRAAEGAAGEAENAHVLFNNNRSPEGDGGFVAQAAANAQQLKRLLSETPAKR